ncbi:MAG: ATP-binding protein [Bacillota bacterium]|jgi:hypothetical protein|nr:ATP-binding protein [Bacillota bacterium]NLJ03256.1 ATP-binding protein [Bacillota bacterium]
MRELSLHILDIVQNSIAAGASLVELHVVEDLAGDWLVIEIADDGKGIPQQQLGQVTDPFFTSRTTRPVGLGLALFSKAAEQAEGELLIDSQVGIGTKVRAVFRYSHIDRVPLGDIAGTVLAIISLNPQVDVVYRHSFCESAFSIDTRRIKHELDAVEISHPAVASWLESFLRQGIDDLYRGD